METGVKTVEYGIHIAEFSHISRNADERIMIIVCRRHNPAAGCARCLPVQEGEGTEPPFSLLAVCSKTMSGGIGQPQVFRLVRSSP